MPFSETPLGPFTNAYSHSGKFPKNALKRIPKKLITSIDRGNAAFFSNIAESFPNTYTTLIEQCPSIQLLEIVIKRETMLGDEIDDHVYSWGFLNADKLVVANIPYFDPDDAIRIKQQTKYLSSIPEPFSAFYHSMDGMGITSGVGLSCFDLPGGFSDWRNIRDYYLENNLAKSDAEAILHKLNNADLRVFISLRNGDFLIVNLGDATRTLYHVKRTEADCAQVLENAVEVMDEYFSAAICSSAELFPVLD